MIPLVITPNVRNKLTLRHEVNEDEIRECFLNFDGKYLIDSREEHKTSPPTLWFISETHRGRMLKIIFVHEDGNVIIKSAYNANETAIRIYTEMTNTGE